MIEPTDAVLQSVAQALKAVKVCEIVRGPDGRLSQTYRVTFAALAAAAIKAYRTHPDTLAGDIRVANMFRLLCLYREAVVIDVTMEGPVFQGVNRSALRRAWEAEKRFGFGEEPLP